MMTYSLLFLSLSTILVLLHLIALLFPSFSKKFLSQFSRSSFWGILLFSLVFITTLYVLLTTDLGEFTSLRTKITLFASLLLLTYGFLVPQFRSVRSLGFLILLGAQFLLKEISFFVGIPSFLWTLLTYFWISFSLFLIAKPYLLRNIVSFLIEEKRNSLWTLLALLGLIYSGVLFSFSFSL